jgi:hypothetical protein
MLLVFKQTQAQENPGAQSKYDTMFEGPVGEALFAVVCDGIKGLSGDRRYDLEMCTRARSKSGFDKYRNRIMKKSTSINTFLRNNWVTWDAISAEDKAKICKCAKDVQKELVNSYEANDHYYD